VPVKGNYFIFVLVMLNNDFFRKALFYIFLALLTLNVSGQDTAIKYIFLGHCYEPVPPGNKVDSRVEEFDFTNFTGIWLGGDVCIEAMVNYSTVLYIDSLFNLSNPETHWALGNHDAREGNWEWYREFTGRDTYYAYCSHGITRIIMNTNLVPTQCEMLNDEYTMISNVCDTISKSNHLILLMHHGLWRDVPDLPPPSTYAHSDLKYWNANCDSVNN